MAEGNIAFSLTLCSTAAYFCQVATSELRDKLLLLLNNICHLLLLFPTSIWLYKEMGIFMLKKSLCIGVTDSSEVHYTVCFSTKRNHSVHFMGKCLFNYWRLSQWQVHPYLIIMKHKFDVCLSKIAIW